MRDPEAAAERRIRYLTPLNAGKVLAHPRYQTRPFLRRYLARAWKAMLLDPEDGFLYGLHAQELARRVPLGATTGYATEQERHSFILEALGLLGRAAAGCGEETKAQASFAEGALLERRHELEPWARIRFRTARAEYLVSLGHDPHDLVQETVRLIVDSGTPERFSAERTRASFARVRFALANGSYPDDLSRVLETLDGNDPELRWIDEVLLADLLAQIKAETITRPTLAGVASSIAARRKTGKGELRIRYFWIEGLINHKLGILRNAKRRLRWAHHYAKKYDSPDRDAIIDDLVALLKELGEEEELAGVLEETGP